jgi:hypothetical protein
VDTWSRVKHAVTLTHELLQWVKTSHPYWNRTGGADHIWHFAHDEGACWAPQEVYERSVVLTHWGRVGADHVSGTSYYPVSARILCVWCVCNAMFVVHCALLCSKSTQPSPPLTPSRTKTKKDNYTAEVTDDPFQPDGFTRLIGKHPCYTPGKDLVIPLFRDPGR